MNAGHNSIFRLNGYKFNLLFGLITFIAAPFLSQINMQQPGIMIGIFGALMYFGEAWALFYKVRITRARVVYERTGGSLHKIIPPLPNIGCIVTYGFFMRLVFRIVFLVMALSGFGLMTVDGSEEVGGIAIGFLIAGVLFEMILLGVSWIDSRLEKDEEEDNPQKEEVEWRKQNFGRLKDPNASAKEMAADFILLITAMMFTHLFWTMSNNEMIGSIDRSFQEGSSALSEFLLIFICNVVLCLIMLVPVRLAYWVGESISVIDGPQRWKLRLSMLFAGISITFPVFAHWFQVYFL